MKQKLGKIIPLWLFRSVSLFVQNVWVIISVEEGGPSSSGSWIVVYFGGPAQCVSVLKHSILSLAALCFKCTLENPWTQRAKLRKMCFKGAPWKRISVQQIVQIFALSGLNGNTVKRLKAVQAQLFVYSLLWNFPLCRKLKWPRFGHKSNRRRDLLVTPCGNFSILHTFKNPKSCIENQYSELLNINKKSWPSVQAGAFLHKCFHKEQMTYRIIA